MWLGAKRSYQKPLFWSGYPGASIREGQWRFYRAEKRTRGKYGDLLFDVINDPGERDNLIHSYPEVADRLRKKVEAWGRELPKPEPRPKKKS